MIEIVIHARRRQYRRELPESWNDVPAARRLAWLTWWITDPSTAAERITRHCVRLPRRVWSAMAPADRAALVAALEWTEPKPDCQAPPISSFRHRGRTYLFPRPKFENGTCIDFALSDDYYSQFASTGDPVWLMRLCATLCRERKRNRKQALTSGDERVSLRQKEEVEDRVRRLKGLSPVILVAALMYFAGVKQYVSKVYHVLFDKPPEDMPADDTQPDQDSGGPKFGWWSVFMGLANHDVQAYEALLQRRFNLICVFLVDQHDRNEKLRAHYERERRKNSSTL